jgi:hypothetical protein
MLIGKDFMFVHVPKTGGTSIEDRLGAGKNGFELGCQIDFDIHDILLTVWRYMPDKDFKRRFKFGFVRNPFDREVSNYFWHTQVNVTIKKEISFSDWVEWRYNEADNVPLRWFDTKADFYYNKGFAKSPQIGYFVNSYGDIMADFIGRYETLAEDWSKVASRIGRNPNLPHHYKSTRDSDYRRYYTDKLVDIVGKAHQLDLIAFNYDFEHGMVSDKICSSWRLNGRYDLTLTPHYTYFYG